MRYLLLSLFLLSIFSLYGTEGTRELQRDATEDTRAKPFEKLEQLQESNESIKSNQSRQDVNSTKNEHAIRNQNQRFAFLWCIFCPCCCPCITVYALKERLFDCCN